MSRRGRRLLIAGVVLVVVLGLSWGTMGFLDRQGTLFFDRGKEIYDTLRDMGKTVQDRDLAALESHFDPGYKGTRLGLTSLVLDSDKDGVRRYLHKSDGEVLDRTGALAEWRDYLGSFESVEEVTMRVHRMESWRSDDERTCSVRFELIGTPKGAPHASIDRAYFHVRFRPAAGGLKIAEASLFGDQLALEAERIVSDTYQFEDVAPAAGVNFMNQYYPRFLSEPQRFGMIRYGPAGISAADYNNDGYYDLFVPDGVESRLFRNSGDGTFEDVTAKSGLSGLDGVSVGIFADYDNDGYKDFFVSRTFNPNQLFHNNGNGTFTDVTAKAGIGTDCCTTVASWADYNNDGFLDLYVGRYLDPRLAIPTTFYARNGEPNQLYRNNGNGTFTNVTATAKVDEPGLCLGSVFGDYDDDGYPDLYVVNDFGRNTLYHNERNGTFKDVSTYTGTLCYGAGMSAAMGDYNNDGLIDIYVANIRSEEAWYAEWPTVGRYMVNCFRQGVWKTDVPLYMQVFRQSGFGYVEVFQQMASGNTMLQNTGDGKFKDVTWQTNSNPLGWFWGASFADFDNDGWQDIYAANGWVYNDRGTEIELQFLNNVVSKQDVYKTGIFFDPKHFGRNSWHGWERNRLLRATGKGAFHEIGRGAGTDLILNSRGVALADYWNRGVIDIAVAASTDRHALLRNQIPMKRNWLQVELIGTKSNRDAVGARVTAKVGAGIQTREVVLGDGYGSQNTLRQHFGLADATQVDELTVRWPRSGIVQRFTNVPANRIIEITEGSDAFTEKNYKKETAK